MHSGLLLLLWMAGIALLQFLRIEALLVAVSVCAVAALALARARSWRLLKRVRYLLLAIVVLFAGFTPGEALLAEWPGVSPSREGMSLAIEHAARIIAAVLCVAVLMERLSPDRLVSGIYALLRPFEGSGLPAARVAVRLLLVLRLVEARAPTRWQAWLEESDEGAGETVHVVRERLRPTDFVVFVVFGAVIAAIWYLQ